MADTLPPERPRLKRAAQFLGTILATAAAILLARYGLKPAPVPVPEAVPAMSMGWVQDDDASMAIAAAQPAPTLAQTPAGNVPIEALPNDVFLWQLERDITGQNPPPQNQRSVGSCTSFGTARAIERTLAGQRQGAPPEKDFPRIVEETIYGGSRFEIGGGRIRGDGSLGAWAAQSVKQNGAPPRGEYPGYDLRAYSESRCRQWGQSGIPDDFEPTARKYPVKGITQIKSWQQAKQALASKYGIAVCSNVGFEGMRRDSRGVLEPSGVWPHCMCLDGYHIEPDGTEYGHIENSWGADAHKGPVGWGDPSTAGFWTRSTTIDRMLKQNDSWAFSVVNGFPARLDWIVKINDPRRAIIATTPINGGK